MTGPLRRRLEPYRLPIVDVDFMVRVFRDPKIKKALIGVRRQVVEKATQVLVEAKRRQINGQVELDVSVLSLVFQAAALTIEWQGDLLFFQFSDDEQTELPLFFRDLRMLAVAKPFERWEPARAGAKKELTGSAAITPSFLSLVESDRLATNLKVIEPIAAARETPAEMLV